MARTNVKGTQVLDGSVGRVDLNTTVSGSAVITKLIASNGVAMTAYTGADSGTGDVTVAADLTFLDTKYPSITTNRTQNHVLAAPVSGSGAASFRALVAGDIPAIGISGITGLQSALDAKLSGAGTTNYIAKYTGSGTLGDSSIFDNAQGVGIGSTAPGINTLKVSKAISTSGLGGGVAIGIRSDGEVASDVSATAYYFRSDASTATAVTNVMHYSANQSTFGGTVGTQTGFYVDAFSAATTNIGFRGNIAASTNNWNLYMSGTANNYLNGSLGIGTTAPSTRLSLGSFWSSSAETVGINLYEGSIAGDLPAYGIGFGPASSEGYINYRSGTSSSSIFGHKFFVNNVEVMRVRGDGNFGIGTSAPIYKLDVSGNARLTSNLIITGAVANGSTIAYFDNNNTTTGQSFGLLIDAGTSTNDYVLKLRNATATEMLIFNGAGSLGIGSSGTLISSSTLTLAKSLNSATSYGIYNYGQITSNNIGNAYYYRSLANTQAASFTVNAIIHYSAAQGTIGVDSSVTNQYGFLVENTMTGASNNYGFYSSLQSGNWNLYMPGTGSNFLNGRLGIGSNVLVDRNLQLILPITGDTTAYGMINNGQVQSGVTANAYQYFSQANAAADVALNNFSHYTAIQGTISGSITYQNGFYVPALTGASNNYAFRGSVTSATGAWNLYMDGTANNYIGSKIGVGTLSFADRNLALGLPLSSSTPYSFINFGTVQASTTSVFMNYSQANVASGANASSLYHFVASEGTVSGTIGNQYGFFASSALTGGTNNYGFYGNLPAGTGLWNLYMNSSANNYMGGRLGIGSTTLTQANVNITLPFTGNATYYGIQNSGIIQSEVISLAVYYRTNASTQAANFTLSNLVHFGAYKGSIGAGCNITNQIGFFVDGSLVGATGANYGFYSGIASSSTNWNLFMAGSATNHMNGSLWIGTNAGSFKLDVNGNARFTQDVQFDSNAICSTAPTSANHLANKAYVDSLSSVKRGEAVKTVSLANITLSGTQTVNSVALVAEDLALVAGQTLPRENGVYVVKSGAWVRSTNNDTEAEIKGAYHLITSGTYANSRYINTNSGTITVGTTDITYTLDFGAETDPVWSAFKSAYDITPTRIANWNDAYSNRISIKTTTDLAEGSSLYFTTARVLVAALTGYSVGTNTTLTATDTILQAFQKLQGQVNNRLTLGGNTAGAAIIVGTNDNFDFSIERNNSTQLTFQSGVSKFFFDVDVVGKIKLNGNAGLDHQFIKYNGSSNEWATLNTGELSDKKDIVLFDNYSGERGFQMYSDNTNTYANSLIFSNHDAGIALGLHGYSVDGSDAIKEFGMQLDMDGYLYHRKLDGTRVKIATVDMISGSSGGTWSGGNISDNIFMPLGKNIYWDFNNNGAYIGFSSFDNSPMPSDKKLLISSSDIINVSASNYITISSQKILLQNFTGTPVELDLSGANSFPDGQYLRFRVASSGGTKKLTIVSD